MTKDRIIDILNDFTHRGYGDWENRIVEKNEELSEGMLLRLEAYSIAKELLKTEKRDQLIEWYLKRRKRIVISKTKTHKFKILPQKDKRKCFDWIEVELTTNSEGEKSEAVLSKVEGLSDTDMFEKICSNIDLFFHFDYNEVGLLIREYND